MIPAMPTAMPTTMPTTLPQWIDALDPETRAWITATLWIAALTALALEVRR